MGVTIPAPLRDQAHHGSRKFCLPVSMTHYERYAARFVWDDAHVCLQMQGCVCLHSLSKGVPFEFVCEAKQRGSHTTHLV